MHLLNLLVLFSWVWALPLLGAASPIQTHQPPPPASPKKDDQIVEIEALEAQRRTFATSIIMSLADEARSYKDLELRARVLARSADALWDVDPDGARTLVVPSAC